MNIPLKQILKKEIYFLLIQFPLMYGFLQGDIKQRKRLRDMILYYLNYIKDQDSENH